MIKFNEFVYSFGGISLNSELKSAERFHINLNNWYFINDMPEARFGESCTRIKTQIFITGKA